MLYNNERFNFIFFTKKKSSSFENDDSIHEKYEIKKNKEICMIYIDDFTQKIFLKWFII